MSAMHTPTPWHSGGTFNPGPDEYCTVWSKPPPGMQSGDMVAQYVTLNDAAHIVRCVNVHDDLCEELSRLVRLLEPMERDGSLNVPGLATLNGARAVLARATAK